MKTSNKILALLGVIATTSSAKQLSQVSVTPSQVHTGLQVASTVDDLTSSDPDTLSQVTPSQVHTGLQVASAVDDATDQVSSGLTNLMLSEVTVDQKDDDEEHKDDEQPKDDEEQWDEADESTQDGSEYYYGYYDWYYEWDYDSDSSYFAQWTDTDQYTHWQESHDGYWQDAYTTFYYGDWNEWYGEKLDDDQWWEPSSYWSDGSWTYSYSEWYGQYSIWSSDDYHQGSSYNDEYGTNGQWSDSYSADRDITMDYADYDRSMNWYTSGSTSHSYELGEDELSVWEFADLVWTVGERWDEGELYVTVDGYVQSAYQDAYADRPYQDAYQSYYYGWQWTDGDLVIDYYTLVSQSLEWEAATDGDGESQDSSASHWVDATATLGDYKLYWTYYYQVYLTGDYDVYEGEGEASAGKSMWQEQIIYLSSDEQSSWSAEGSDFVSLEYDGYYGDFAWFVDSFVDLAFIDEPIYSLEDFYDPVYYDYWEFAQVSSWFNLYNIQSRDLYYLEDDHYYDVLAQQSVEGLLQAVLPDDDDHEDWDQQQPQYGQQQQYGQQHDDDQHDDDQHDDDDDDDQDDQE